MKKNSVNLFIYLLSSFVPCDFFFDLVNGWMDPMTSVV